MMIAPVMIAPVLITTVNILSLGWNHSVLAQVNDPRKAEADRLFRQGLEQAQADQFNAAIQAWEQALVLYRQINDRPLLNERVFL